MSQVEQKLENRVELPEKEDVERVAYCAGAYLSAFSKEPFNEKWSIDGKESSGFLLNPKTTGDFVKEVFNQSDLEITKTSEGGENIKVNKDLIVEHIDKTLASPMTEQLLEIGWFSRQQMEELVDLREGIAQKEVEEIDLYVSYPLTSILEAYDSAVKNPVSMVLLGSQNEENLEIGGKINYSLIEPGSELPENIYPRLVSRYVSANSPKSKEGKNAQDFVLEEIDYYINEKEGDQIRKVVPVDSYVLYLGELAKIPSSDKSIDALNLSTAEYVQILTSIPDAGKEVGLLDLIPEQMVCLSVEGTSVVSKSKTEEGTKLLETVNRGFKKFGVKFKEDIFYSKHPRDEENKVVTIILSKLQ